MFKMKFTLFAGLASTALLLGGGAMVQAAPPLMGDLAPGQSATVGAQGKVDLVQTADAAARAARARATSHAVNPFAAAAAQIPVRPTVSDAEYNALKASAENQAVSQKAAGARGAAPAGPLAPPHLLQGSFDGNDQSGCFNGGCIPSDDTIAAGGGVSQEVVQLTNSTITVFDHAGNSLSSQTINAFFGKPLVVFNDLLFDSRILYDTTWNRWIIISDSFSTNANTQLLWIAVSQTDDATGACGAGFFCFTQNVTFIAGDFFDYPELGQDQDSVLITANRFTASGAFRDAVAEGIAKARLYNGLTANFPVFTGLCGTLAPPNVIQNDQNGADFFICARPSGSTIPMYAGREFERPGSTTLVLQANIPVPAYVAPPNASQPGTGATRDTLDARYQIQSTQFGSTLENAHAVNFGGPAVQVHKFNTATNSVIRVDTTFRSGTSEDFSPAVTFNANGDEFLSAMVIDVPPGLQLSQEFSGSQGNQPITLNNAPLTFTSPTFNVNFRLGDYGGISLDPVTGVCAAFRSAWITQEDNRVNPNTGNSDWFGTNFSQIGAQGC